MVTLSFVLTAILIVYYYLEMKTVFVMISVNFYFLSLQKLQVSSDDLDASKNHQFAAGFLS